MFPHDSRRGSRKHIVHSEVCTHPLGHEDHSVISWLGDGECSGSLRGRWRALSDLWR